MGTAPIKCPSCGTSVKATAVAGEWTTCGHCHRNIRVPHKKDSVQDLVWGSRLIGVIFLAFGVGFIVFLGIKAPSTLRVPFVFRETMCEVKQSWVEKTRLEGIERHRPC